MGQENRKVNFWNKLWGVFGKFALLIGAIWGCVQLWTYFTTDTSYEVEISGNHYNFLQPHDVELLMYDYYSILALDKSYCSVVSPKGVSINALKELAKKDKNDQRFGIFINNYESYHSYYAENALYKKYKSFWWFDVTNKGSKPLEDLNLELPFSGYYLITQPNEKSESGSFTNRISLKELRPTYSIKIYLWVSDDNVTSEYDKEKVRITHKYGSANVDYPIAASGLNAWDIEYGHLPLFFFFAFIAILLIISFTFGYTYGPKIDAYNNRIKLKQFEEMEKLKKDKEKENSQSDDLEQSTE